MHHYRCINELSSGQCKNTFRTKSTEDNLFCRQCYKREYGKPRPITSREVIHGAYRRTRSRRKNVTTKKVVSTAHKGKAAQRNKKNTKSNTISE